MIESLPEGHPIKKVLEEAKEMIDEVEAHGESLQFAYNQKIHTEIHGVGGLHDIAEDEDDFISALHAFRSVELKAWKSVEETDDIDVQVALYNMLAASMLQRAKTMKEIDAKKNDIENRLKEKMDVEMGGEE